MIFLASKRSVTPIVEVWRFCVLLEFAMIDGEVKAGMDGVKFFHFFLKVIYTTSPSKVATGES